MKTKSIKWNYDERLNTFKVLSDNVKIYSLSDLHLGSKVCDEVFIKHTIQKIKDDPEALFFLNGDVMEFIPDLYKISTRGQKMTLNEQRSFFIELFRPIIKKCLFYRSGNHEDRSTKILGKDEVPDICRELNILCFAEDRQKYIIKNNNDKKLVIFSEHGNSGGQAMLADAELQKIANNKEGVDIIILGHNHQLWAKDIIKDAFDENTGKSYKKIVMIGRSGSFLNYGGYARAAMFNPSLMGCLVVSLEKTGKKTLFTYSEKDYQFEKENL
jgi:predicted phosphodiesterase